MKSMTKTRKQKINTETQQKNTQVQTKHLKQWKQQKNKTTQKNTKATLPKIEKNTHQVPACQLAGFFLHTEHVQQICSMVTHFEKVLNCRSGLLKKKSFTRKLYDCGSAFCRIFEPHNADAPYDADVWLHLGFGNLNTDLYTVLNMDFLAEESAPLLPTACRLSPSDPVKPHTLWEVRLRKYRWVRSRACVDFIEEFTSDQVSAPALEGTCSSPRNHRFDIHALALLFQDEL